MPTLAVTRPNGDEHTILFDECDRALVESHTWTIKPQRNTYYAVTKIAGRVHRLHRMMIDAPRIDHINRDGLDCRRSNLRVITTSLNAANSTSRGGTSKYKGVSAIGNRWRAVIQGEGKSRVFIGSFTSEDEAAAAYDKAARERWGDAAWLNSPVRGYSVRDR